MAKPYQIEFWQEDLTVCMIELSMSLMKITIGKYQD